MMQRMGGRRNSMGTSPKELQNNIIGVTKEQDSPCRLICLEKQDEGDHRKQWTWGGRWAWFYSGISQKSREWYVGFKAKTHADSKNWCCQQFLLPRFWPWLWPLWHWYWLGQTWLTVGSSWQRVALSIPTSSHSALLWANVFPICLFCRDSQQGLITRGQDMGLSVLKPGQSQSYWNGWWPWSGPRACLFDLQQVQQLAAKHLSPYIPHPTLGAPVAVSSSDSQP